MRKMLVAVLGPCGAVAAATIGFIWWERGAPPGFNPTPHPVTVSSINRENRGVRIRGTAHYEVRLRQKMEDGSVYYIFPLMKAEDTLGREIKVLVRAERMPDAMTTYEDMEVDGLARPPGTKVGPKTRESLLDGGYHFAEGYVLVEAFAIRD
ncbi:MAG: hypothetical protein CL930_14035 [Deltaproteobacteria bacterium]|nr:hypothetical protein [Deltaproteobacteria bacterium]